MQKSWLSRKLLDDRTPLAVFGSLFNCLTSSSCWFCADLCMCKYPTHPLRDTSLYFWMQKERSSNLSVDGWVIEEASSVESAVTPASICVWPDPAVLLNLTCYMMGALAHLASLRQPLAAIWVSLSAPSGVAPRIAEVVNFPPLSHSLWAPPFFLPNLHTSALPPPDSVTRPRCFGPQGFSTSGDFSLEMKIPEIIFSSTISWRLTVLWLERNQRKAKKKQKQKWMKGVTRGKTGVIKNA